MTRFLFALTLLASTAFAETGVVIDFQQVLRESNYGYRAREAAEARTKGKSADEKKKAEAEEYEKVYALAFPLMIDFAQRQKLDFVFLTERGVLYADSFLTHYVTQDLIEALNRHSRDGKATFESSVSDRWTLRVAVMNVEAAFENSKTGEAAAEKVEERIKRGQAELDKLQAEVKELGKKLEAAKKGTPEYEAANSALVDKMRELMTIKQMREYEAEFFRRAAIEDVLEAAKKAAGAVAKAQGYNLVLASADARVVALGPKLDITVSVLAALDAPDEPGKKKAGKAEKAAPKPTPMATIGVRQLWGQIQKLRPDAKPAEELLTWGTRYAESAGLALILDDEVLVYANPARSRTTELGAKLTAE